MKTYIVYNKIYSRSKSNAAHCLSSFANFSGWEPELYDGCTPERLKEFESKYPLSDQRHQFINSPVKMIESKKSCFYSHYDLWNRCVQKNEPIAIIEHDTMCIDNYNIPKFDESSPLAIQLTTDSTINLWRYYRTRENKKMFEKNGDGLHKIFYVHAHGKRYMAGHTGYIITPAACDILIKDCEKNGWEQNDLLTSDEVFPLYYIRPSPIMYVKTKELKSSSGHGK